MVTIHNRARHGTDNITLNKIYFRHSEYVGSAKYTSLREMMQKKPVRVIEHAVRGMLPKGRLGDQMYTKLHVYAGPEHPHAAQKPEELKF